MAMDWVPQVDYGIEASNASANLVMTLLSPDAGQDVVGKVEDTDDLFCHRIVGDVFWTLTGILAGTRLLVGIMPLQYNYQNALAQIPWDGADNFWGGGLAENANLRFWTMRTFQAAGTSMGNLNTIAGATADQIPWHWHFDLKPRQKCGSRLNLWPTLIFSIGDNDVGSLRVTSNLRLLMSGR